MTIRLAESGIRVVLLDIEGTTTPLAFVREVLFPFARAHAAAWFAHHAAPDADRPEAGPSAPAEPDRSEAGPSAPAEPDRPEAGTSAPAETDRPEAGASAPAEPEDGRVWMAALKAEHDADAARGEPVPAWHDTGPAGSTDGALAYVFWLMDRDRKSPALKELQGRIWEQGYQSGVLRGVVFDDVPEAFARWRQAGVRIAIYSSGSELAQRRLFESVGRGETRADREPPGLAEYVDAYFDTRVGAKRDAESYRTIAARLGEPAARVLFVSDVTAELAAAREAGCQVALSLRPGNDPQPDALAFTAIETFAELV